ncbi:hypothetical protein ACTWPB_14180 [Nocardia sp. IBHARD005]|uniref:hypothetical protein n=1 Tax=Nocardia sp. IBHARD005 TaxID=3457765 RepID=UPI0040582368
MQDERQDADGGVASGQGLVLEDAVLDELAARYLAPEVSEPGEGTLLELDRDGRRWGFVRPDEPFTPTEIARAHRLADLAALTARQRCGSVEAEVAGEWIA